MFPHPQSEDNIEKDVALIKLKQAFRPSPTVGFIDKILEPKYDVDFNEKIRNGGIECVFQSWGDNRLVQAGDKWTYGHDKTTFARQGRVKLIRHDQDFDFFISSGGPIVVGGDSGAPLMCLPAAGDPVGEGVMFAVVSRSFVYDVDVDWREHYKWRYGCERDCAESIDVRPLDEWIKKAMKDHKDL